MTLHSKMAKEDTANRPEKRRPQSDGAGPSNVKRHRCDKVNEKVGEGSGSSGSQSSAGPSNVKKHRCDKVNEKVGEGSGSSGSQSSAGPSNVKKLRCDKVNVKVGEGSGSSGSQSSAGPSNVNKHRCGKINEKVGEGSGSSGSQSSAGPSNVNKHRCDKVNEKVGEGSGLSGSQSGAGSSGARAEAARTEDSGNESGAGSSGARAKAANNENSGNESDNSSTYSKAETVCMDELVEMKKAAASTPADVAVYSDSDVQEAAASTPADVAVDSDSDVQVAAASTPADVAVDSDSDVQEVVANSPEIVIIESDSEDAELHLNAGTGAEVADIIPADVAVETQREDAVDAKPDAGPQNDAETDESRPVEGGSAIPAGKCHKCRANCPANETECLKCRFQCVANAVMIERRSGLLSPNGAALPIITCQKCGCQSYAVMDIAKQLNCNLQVAMCPTYAVMRCVTHQKRVECVERQEPEYGKNDKIEPKRPAEERGVKRKWQEHVEKHREQCECHKVQRYQVMAFEENEDENKSSPVGVVELSDSDVPLEKEDKNLTGQEAGTQNWRQGLSNGSSLP